MANSRRSFRVPPGLLFALPVVAIFLVVRVVPALSALYLSFTDFTGVARPKWIGLANYLELTRDPVFRQALLNTIIYTLGVAVPSTLLGLAIALLLNTTIFFRGLFRTLFFLPAVVSFVSIAVIWAYMLNSQFGILNYGLSLLGVTILDYVVWRMVKDVIVCYRCQAVHRGYPANGALKPFDLVTHDRHVYGAAPPGAEEGHHGVD